MSTAFYVYEHIRPDRGSNGEVFYVGKGKGRRANNMAERNSYHKAIQNKLSRMGLCVEIRLVATGLTETEAFALERNRIAFWRSDGCDLANFTNGGEGACGAVQSEEIRAKKRAKLAGRPRPESHRAAMRGVPKTAEHREKLRLANTGRSASPEARAKMSAARKDVPQTPESNLKRSLAQKGRPKPPGFMAKLTAANRGRKHSSESVARGADKRRGIPLSEAHKAKLREAHANPELKKAIAEKISATWTPERRAKPAEVARLSTANREANRHKRTKEIT